MVLLLIFMLPPNTCQKPPPKTTRPRKYTIKSEIPQKSTKYRLKFKKSNHIVNARFIPNK